MRTTTPAAPPPGALPMAALAPGRPESVGMSTDLLERAAGVLADAIAAGDISAASIIVCRGPHVVLSRGLGVSRPDAQGEPVGPDSVFLLASISKTFAAISLMLLVDRGVVALLDPVEAYLPGFGGGRGVTVKDLLTRELPPRPVSLFHPRTIATTHPTTHHRHRAPLTSSGGNRHGRPPGAATRGPGAPAGPCPPVHLRRARTHHAADLRAADRLVL